MCAYERILVDLRNKVYADLGLGILTPGMAVGHI